MSLQQIKNMKEQKGFTIVELLIVIVVIGILAAIVIVAYTGITRTANNNKIKSNATSIAKLAETVNANSGSYPADLAGFTNTTDGVTTRPPNGITIATAPASPAIPLNTDANVDAAKNGTVQVRYCTGGLNVFYPVEGTAVTANQQVIRVGAGC